MTHKKQWIGYVEASSERLLKEQSDAQKAVSHCAALIESRWIKKTLKRVSFLFVGTLSDRGTRDSVRTDLKERSNAQKAVSHYAALIESRWLEKAHVMNIVLFLFM